MTSRNYAQLGLLVAPLAAIVIGVWAEFAELTPLVLSAVSIPAIIVSTISAAVLARRVPVVPALVVGGIVVGAITFGLAAGTHVLLSWLRGSELEFSDYDSRALISLAFVSVHLAVGTMVGAGVGVVLAVLYAGTSWVMRRAAPRADDEDVIRS